MKHLFLLFMVVLVVSCGKNPTPDEGKADRLAAAFIKAIHDQNYETLPTLVDSEVFFGAHTESDWKEYLSKSANILGKVETTRLKQKLNDIRLSGTFFIYEYVSKHEHGLSKELITIIHKINTGDAPLKVFSYKIESSKLAKLNQNW
jgi:hypothetical protein